MTDPSFGVIPILRVNNASEAKAFYCDYLDFELEWEHYFEPNAPVYMQVSRSSFRLQLSANERFRFGSALYIDTIGIKEFQAQLLAKPCKFETPEVTASPWNTLQMEMQDPFTNLLRFHQSLT